MNDQALNELESISLCNKAVELHRAGRLTRAIEYLRKAISLDPRCVDAFLALGSMIAEEKSTERKYAEANSGSLIEPDNALLRCEVADYLYTLGDEEQARKHWTEALTVAGPHLTDHVQNRLKRYYADHWEEHQDLTHVDQSVAFTSKDTSLLVQVAVDLYSIADLKRAASVLRAVIKLDRHNRLARMWLAAVYRDLGEQEAALAIYRQVISSRYSDPNPHHELAATLLDLGRNDDAVREWRVVQRLSPEDDRAAAGIAEALRKIGAAADPSDTYRDPESNT